MLTEFAKSHSDSSKHFSAQYCHVISTYSWEKSHFNQVLTDVQECVRWSLIDIPWRSHYHLSFSLSGFWEYCQTKTLCWSDLDLPGLGLAVRFSCYLWAWPPPQMTQWARITGLHSLISVSNDGLVSDNYAPGIIPSSCSPIWIFMPHCQWLTFSSELCSSCSPSIKDLNTEAEGSEVLGPDYATLTLAGFPTLWLSVLCHPGVRGNLMRPLGYFNQGEYSNLITIGTGSWSRVVKFCQLWSTHSHKN